MLADMGKLDPDDERPPYQQIADALRAQIESGELAPGDQLPAIPVLTSEYDVSIGTARSALTALRDDGLIVTRQGKGSYVRTRPRNATDDADSDMDELRHSVEALTERVEALERKLAD
ncbi:hypothetical protein GCM10025762_60330 [Haloechinothrix salitolerans]